MPDDRVNGQTSSQSIAEKETALQGGKQAEKAANFMDGKQAEQEREELVNKLQAANALLDALFTKAPVGFGFLDCELRTIRINDALAAMSGIPAEQRTGETIDELLPEVDKKVTAMLRHVIASGEPVIGQEVSGFTPAVPGEKRYWSANYYPVYMHDEVVGVGVVCTEITQGKQAEIERKKAQEREHFLSNVSKVLASSLDYQTTVSNIAKLVVPNLADWFVVDLVDEQGNFQLLEVAHRDPEKVAWAYELRKKLPIDPEAQGSSQNIVRTGQPELYPYITDEMLVASVRNEEELEMYRKIGFSSVMAVPLVARGKILGVVTFVHAESGRRYDENDLALAEEVGRRAGVALDNARLYREVKEARDQLDIILQGVADSIVVQDSEGRMIFVNEAATVSSGFASAEEMMKTPGVVILGHGEMVDEAGQPFPLEHLPNRRAYAGERDPQATIGYRNRITGQPERWLIMKARSIYDEHGKVMYVITMSHDITERQLAEKRKDEFISMASHELKTPVTSIKGFTQVLSSRLKYGGDEQAQRFLERMDTQTQ